MHSPHIKNRDLCSIFLKLECLHKLYKFFLHEKLVCFHLFFFLFIQSFVSVVIHGYLFYTLYYNPILLYLSFRSNCFSFGPWEFFSWFLCPSLLSGMRRCLKFIMYISCPSPRIGYFPRSLGSFYWRIQLETKIWALGMPLLPGDYLLLGPLS